MIPGFIRSRDGLVHSVVMVAQGVEVAGAGEAYAAASGQEVRASRRLATAALGSFALLIVGAALLWVAQADAVFLDILSAGLPGCF